MKRLSFALFTILIITIALGGSGCGNCYAVYGRVADELDQGIANVMIAFSGGDSGTTNTDANGNWSKVGLKGTVLVTPSRTGWTFDPVNKQVTKAASNVNFVATLSETPEFTEERAQEIIVQFDDVKEILAGDNPIEMAVTEALERLATDPTISRYGQLIVGQGVWWETYEGIKCIVNFLEFEEEAPLIKSAKTTSPRKPTFNQYSIYDKSFPPFFTSPTEHISSLTEQFVGNREVIILGPWWDSLPFCHALPISLEFAIKGPYLNVHTFLDIKCDVELFKTLGDYGTIVYSGHSGVIDDICILTRTLATPAAQVKYYNDLERQGGNPPRLEIVSTLISGLVGDEYFAITPQFIIDYCSPMPNSIVYIGACESAYDDSMWQAFKNKGAQVYYGYDINVSPLIDWPVGLRLFSSLLDGNSTGSAFMNINSDYPNFIMFGADNIKLPTGEPTLNRIEVSPTSFSIEVGHSVELTATGYDQYGDPIAFSEMPSWSVTGGIGSVNPAFGSSTTFTALVVGTGAVTAMQSAVSGSADITVTEAVDQEITLTLPGGVPLTMALIPAGTFMMGSPEDEQDRDSDEGPQHQVTITEPFYMGIYEVTQAQWEAVMGANPSYFLGDTSRPVERVSWYDCQEFVTELNTMGLGTFRLPTEAEWEYACRAGSTTRFPWGDDPTYGWLGEYAWYRNNSSSTTHPVGQKEANIWGLFDMHGNVWEWCGDWYAAYGYDAQTDPSGPESGSTRVFRGGSWVIDPQCCRSAFRGISTPTSTGRILGFRLVREY